MAAPSPRGLTALHLATYVHIYIASNIFQPHFTFPIATFQNLPCEFIPLQFHSIILYIYTIYTNMILRPSLKKYFFWNVGIITLLLFAPFTFSTSFSNILSFCIYSIDHPLSPFSYICMYVYICMNVIYDDLI